MTPTTPAFRSLRIVFFTSYCHVQGTYFRWHNWAKALLELGHQIEVYTCDNTLDGTKRTEWRDGIAYHIIPGTSGQRFFGSNVHPVTTLKRMAMQYPKADVYHFFQPFPSGAAPAYWHRRNAKLLVYDWDDLWHGGLNKEKPPTFFERYMGAITRYLEHKLPAKIQNVTVCSTYLKELAVQRGAGNAQVIYNGFWPNAQAFDKQAARKAFGFQPNAYYFGFMGRTLEEIEWCFDVLKLSAGHEPPTIRLALCGMHASVLEGLDPMLRERIDFLGNLSSDDARKFAYAIDCGLLPLQNNHFNLSRFPIKFAEYLATGAHVVCSDVGEVSVLARKHKGVKLAGKTREEWQMALEAFMVTDPSSLTRPDLQELSEDLSWRKITEELVRYYLQTMNHQP